MKTIKRGYCEPFGLYVFLQSMHGCFVHVHFNLYNYIGFVIDLILLVALFIEQKSFAASSISPCVHFGTLNLIWAEENKLDKALAFDSNKFRIKSHYFL